jgi:uncharacterized membrane protein
LSDAVFGFAITLLVVSIEVPKSFVQLREAMHGFAGFALCFGILLMIRHAQYIYFRRYALDDRASFILNAALLFVVAFYIYPLEFLFTTFVNLLTGFTPTENGVPLPAMTRPEWSQLMMIYSAGFVGIYLIFALLYLRAHRLRDELELNTMEACETRGVVQENIVMIGIGTLGLGLAWRGQANLSGLSLALIGPLQRCSASDMVVGARR